MEDSNRKYDKEERTSFEKARAIAKNIFDFYFKIYLVFVASVLGI